jgi:AcrR family transcriptional regulator
VVAALLDAATELYAERGPRAVSAREIARRARVNHGLVHRHFGSKDALVRAVLDRLLDDWRQRFAGSAALVDRRELVRRMAGDRRYVKILARALLDGQVEWLADAQFPVVSGAIAALERARARGEIDPCLDPRSLAASYVALALGWLAFGPFVAAATGLGDCPADALDERMLETWERLAARVTPAADRHAAEPAHAE